MVKYVGQDIYGTMKYEYTVNEFVTVYCKKHKDSKEMVVEFVVGAKGATLQMSEERSQDFRFGIEGKVGAYVGKQIDSVMISIKKTGSDFADFYTDEGETIKKLVCCDGKYYMFDENAYYEVTSDTKTPNPKSHEEFIQKDEEHKYPHSDLISVKEGFEKTFINIFKELS